MSHAWLRGLAVLAWVGFLVAVLTSDRPQPDVWTMVMDLFVFRGPDPMVAAAFQMMGVWPMLYGRVLLKGAARQRFLPLLFVVAGFFVGAFALLPAAALRPYGGSTAEDPKWLRLYTETPLVGWALAGAGLSLAVYGVIFGSFETTVALWRSHGFVYAFGIDFCILTAFYPLLYFTERSARP